MRKKFFILTKEHLKLARAMNVSWDEAEFGAPCIDPKRPYGNSDVVLDIHEILDWSVPKDEGEAERYLNGEGYVLARAIHEEMKTALQIILCIGTCDPGHYQADEYFDNWEKTPL